MLENARDVTAGANACRLAPPVETDVLRQLAQMYDDALELCALEVFVRPLPRARPACLMVLDRIVYVCMYIYR